MAIVVDRGHRATPGGSPAHLVTQWQGSGNPTLTIDMVVANVLMSLGMMMLPSSVVSLPFKLIFFVLVDGWRLVSGSLVQSFGSP